MGRFTRRCFYRDCRDGYLVFCVRNMSPPTGFFGFWFFCNSANMSRLRRFNCAAELPYHAGHLTPLGVAYL
jgi:hypothetical protein